MKVKAPFKVEDGKLFAFQHLHKDRLDSKREVVLRVNTYVKQEWA